MKRERNKIAIISFSNEKEQRVNHYFNIDFLFLLIFE